MSYYKTPYKYGVHTKAEIDAIPTSILEIGDNVFNSDIGKEEFWTGNTWINDDCVELTLNQVTAAGVGNLMCIDSLITTAATGSVKFSSTTVANEDRTIGVIYRGGTQGSKVVIAGMGLYPVKVTTATQTAGITRQFLVSTSATAGEAASTGAKTGGQGSFGVNTKTYAANTIPADRLINCWINSAETF